MLVLRPNTQLPSWIPKPQSMNNKTAPRLRPPPSAGVEKQTLVFGLTVLRLWPPVVEYLKAQFKFNFLLPSLCHNSKWWSIWIIFFVHHGFWIVLPGTRLCYLLFRLQNISTFFYCFASAGVAFWVLLFSWSDYMLMSLLFLLFNSIV